MEKIHHLQEDMNIVLAIGGYNYSYLANVESVDLGGGDCTLDLPPLPFGNEQNIGLVNSDGDVMSCGGTMTPRPREDMCLVYNRYEAFLALFCRCS